MFDRVGFIKNNARLLMERSLLPVISADRAYLSYLQGGDVMILDIADKARPKMIAHVDYLPPCRPIAQSDRGEKR
jgi:hypothetical protein